MRTIKLFAVIGLAVALMGVLAMAQEVKTFTFCISGQSDGKGWQYNIEGTNAQGGAINTGNRSVADNSVPQGQNEAAFAQFFVQQLRPIFGTDRDNKDTVNVNTGDSKCFDVKARQITRFLIGSGAQQAPTCNVMTTVGGCAFNPTISLKGLPTLTEWGLIALAVLLAGGMGYMIYRRRPALRPAAP